MESKKVKVLLPGLIRTQEDKHLLEKAKKSIVSFDHCVKVEVDTAVYADKVAGVWTNFFSRWRGKEYDYLMIMANDVVLDPMAIDFCIACLEENPGAGVSTVHVTRDEANFKKGFGQQVRSGRLTASYSQMDPAASVWRKGVIETIGNPDPCFPMEFVERDLWHRCKLAGFKWIEPAETLCYHPPFSTTIGNQHTRLTRALRRYVLKWGGDAGQEVYTHPYNDLSLDFTFTGPYGNN